MPNQKVASVYVDLVLKTAEFKKATQDASSAMKDFSNQSRVEMLKSRESVRLLSEDLGIGLPRGLQNIISKLPAVTTALNAAFNAVIIFAMIDAVVKVTEKVEAFIKKNEEAARKNAEANSKFTDSLEKTIAEQQVANDKMDDATAKLNKKPENLLKLAIDEATLSSIDLSDKLEKNIKDMRELLSLQGAKWYEQLMGAASNDFLNQGLEQYSRNQHDIDTAAAEEMKNPKAYGGVDQITAMQRQAHLKATEGYYNSLTTTISELQDYQRMIEQEEKNNLSGNLQNPRDLSPEDTAKFAVYLQKYGLGDQSQNITAAMAHRANVGLVGVSQEVDVNTAASQAANRAATGANTAATEHLQTLKDEVDQRKALHTISINEEEEFWKKHLADFTGGSKEYLDALKLFSDAQKELLKNYSGPDRLQEEVTRAGGYAAAGRQLATGPKEPDNLNTNIGNEMAADLGRYSPAWEKWNEEVAKGVEQNTLLAAKLDEVKNKIALETGAISPHAAALADAAIHAREYAAQLDTLHDELNRIQSDNTLTPVEKATRAQTVQNQIGVVSGQQRVQAVDDANLIRLTTVAGATSSALDKLTQSFTNAGTAISDTLVRSIDTFNNSLLHTLTTRKEPFEHPFREAGRSIATDVAGAGLKGVEGELLKLFGVGTKVQKIEGTVNLSPATIAALNAGHVSGSAAGIVAGTGGTSSEAASAIQLGLSFIGLATGGVMSPGDMYLTGEQGPELMTVGQTSRIYNTRDTSAMLSGGGGSVHNWNIDARGSNDPAAVRQQVMAGIKAAAPQIVAVANLTNQDRANRTPRMK